MSRVLLLIGVVLLAAGCSSPITGICGVQPIGEDERGIAYFRYYCGPE